MLGRDGRREAALFNYAAGDDAFPAALCSLHHNTVLMREDAQMGIVH